MPSLGPMEIVLILVVILLLFGFKKLPDAARSLGKSARVFKAEVSEMKEEDRQREAEKSARDSGTVESTTTERSPADDAKPRTDNESGPGA
ncbi:Sec-independent protein translocase subunit TatA [Janibacter cremeus]|uniref:Sec-independent protein translocase protein TatA n=1 Tax=Janibacter cremeus TaxID=1285192 RepID=A0A852VHN7_9MICO|nr:Sec-independent protein translocase subunit TatA [Janibacter cremeus]NYF96627.1 sec-independent protein translocase protein TatA [Janibacter cremeus]